MLIRTYRRTYSVQCSDNMLPQLRIKCGVAKSCPGTHTALQVPMANSGISTVERDTEQLSRAMQLTLYHASHACVPTHAQKLSTLNFGFSRNILRQKFSFHVKKKQLVNYLLNNYFNWNGLNKRKKHCQFSPFDCISTCTD